MTTEIPALQPTSPGEEIERLLDERQIDYDEKVISLSEIDLDASTHNQARFLPLHEDVVITYGAAMEQGDKFPPIVVMAKGAKYLVLDGNHRVAAANLVGYKQMTVFVAKNITKAVAELFTYEANARHGLPTSIEERIRQGLYLVNIGNQPKSVARALAIPEAKLYRAMQAAKATQRLTQLGFKPEQMLSSVVIRLGNIASNTVLQSAANLVVGAELDSEESNELITRINARASEGEGAQLATIEEMRQKMKGRIRTTGGGRIELPKNINRIRIAARLVRHIEATELGKQIPMIDETLAQTTRREVFEMIAHLAGVSEAIR